MIHYKRPSVDEQNKKFIAWWKKKQKHKWRFIIGGGLLWGLSTALGSHLLSIRFDFEQFDARYVAINCVVSTIIGILFAYWFYRVNDKRFRQLSDSAD
ncbi:MAG: hypothetical protein WA958_16315 [Tunicatimonas sp.]